MWRTEKIMIAITTSSLTSVGTLDIQRAAAEYGYDIAVYLVDDPETPNLVTQADAVVYRIGPISYPKYEKLFEAMADSPARRLLGDTLAAFDKCRSYEIMAAIDVPMPESVIVDHVGKPAFIPGVVKVPRGNQGKGVELVEDERAYEETVARLLSGGQLLYQRYVPESKGNDKRLLIYKNKLVAAMRRTATGDDFRANLHLGGVASAYTPTQQEIDMAVIAVDAHGLPYAGVDIIDSQEGPLVLEVNPSPGFHISNVSGIDVPAKLLEYMTEKE